VVKVDVEKWSMSKKMLSKLMKTRRYAELSTLGNTSGMKAQPGVANTGRG
jgi:hypothetical protein